MGDGDGPPHHHPTKLQPLPHTHTHTHTLTLSPTHTLAAPGRRALPAGRRTRPPRCALASHSSTLAMEIGGFFFFFLGGCLFIYSSRHKIRFLINSIFFVVVVVVVRRRRDPLVWLAHRGALVSRDDLLMMSAPPLLSTPHTHTHAATHGRYGNTFRVEINYTITPQKIHRFFY